VEIIDRQIEKFSEGPAGEMGQYDYVLAELRGVGEKKRVSTACTRA
jgi:hypothetical protein